MTSFFASPHSGPDAAEPGRPTSRSDLLRATDQCVQCGLCLPYCPTYGVTRDEGDSPRGRIALMQAFLGDRLAAEPRLLSHLDRCLACRACEAVCPSRVPYGTLIDGVRAELEPLRHRGGSRRWLRALALDRLIARPRALRAVGHLLRAYQRAGIRALLRRTGLLESTALGRLDALLPPLEPVRGWRRRYPARGAQRGEVALFTGCVASLADRPALDATISVLTRLGFAVRVPARQACCGALHLHNGAPEPARRLARRNVTAFADSGVDAVITAASGCAAQLVEYGGLLGTPEAAAFAATVRDVSEFVSAAWPDGLDVAPLDASVAVHDPCTLANVLHQHPAPYRLLERIPAIRLAPLGGNPRCCGAAGSYVLTQRSMAGRLREDKLREVAALAPDYLVTSNVGCALHLAVGLRGAANTPELLHPIQLLARQLPD